MNPLTPSETPDAPPAPLAETAPIPPSPVTAPVAVAPMVTPAASIPPPQKKQLPRRLLACGVFCLLVGLAAGFGIGHYALRPAANQPDASKTPVAQIKELEIPKNATVIAECAVGRGKQYVLPEDIPTGPVYNVWNNKVIGVEFMVGRDELLSENKTLVDLPLGGAVYDHINIGLLSQGHSGFPQPHYHVDLFTVPNAEAQQITCK